MSVRNQRLKLLKVKEILERETDNEHGIQMERLLEMLGMHGITAERKSVYTDIDILQNELGMDISRPSGSDKEYRLLSRKFDVSELRLIIDAIQADKFLSEKMCDQLIHKIESLCSRHEAKALQDCVYVAGRVKNPSDSTSVNIGWIHTAILQNRQIMFRYFDWGVDGKKKYRECPAGGNVYVVSPYFLVYEGGKYYLMAYAAYAPSKLRTYRVDKMNNIYLMESARDGHDEMDKVDPVEYVKTSFGMFCGKVEPVQMRFVNGMAGVVRDRFGDVMMQKDGEEHFVVSVSVGVSSQFFGWLFGLGDKVELLGPERVRREWERELENALIRYK